MGQFSDRDTLLSSCVTAPMTAEMVVTFRCWSFENHRKSIGRNGPMEMSLFHKYRVWRVLNVEFEKVLKLKPLKLQPGSMGYPESYVTVRVIRTPSVLEAPQLQAWLGSMKMSGAPLGTRYSGLQSWYGLMRLFEAWSIQDEIFSYWMLVRFFLSKMETGATAWRIEHGWSPSPQASQGHPQLLRLELLQPLFLTLLRSTGVQCVQPRFDVFPLAVDVFRSPNNWGFWSSKKLSPGSPRN